MSFWPQVSIPDDDTPLLINTSSFWCTGLSMKMMDATTAPVSTAWVANLAIFIPFNLPWPYTVSRFFWVNGATLTGPPNTDVGIFAVDGRKIVSTGNTAQSGASTIQFANASTTARLAPGRYYLGYSNSATLADTFCYGGVSVGPMASHQIFQQTSANPLPSSATFARTSNALIPFCGFTRTSSGF